MRVSQILNRIIILPPLPCADGILAKECNLCGFEPEGCWSKFQDLRRGTWREHVGVCYAREE